MDTHILISQVARCLRSKRRICAIIGIIIGTILVLMCAALFIVPWFIPKTISFNETTVDIHGLRFSFGSFYSIDSIDLQSPTMQGQIYAISLRPNLYKTITTFKPAIGVTISNASMEIIGPGKNADRASIPDSISFPNIALPVQGSAHINVAIVQYTNQSEQKSSLEARGIEATVTNRQSLSVSIDSLSHSDLEIGFLEPSASVFWHDSLFVRGSLQLRHNTNSAQVRFKHVKKNILHGIDTIDLDIHSPEPYINILAPSLPFDLQETSLSSIINTTPSNQALSLTSTISTAQAGRLLLNPEDRHTMQLDLAIAKDTNTLRLALEGSGESRIAVSGRFDRQMRLFGWTTLLRWYRTLVFRGWARIEAFPFMISDTIIRTQASLAIEKIDTARAVFQISTIDSSHLNVSIDYADQPPRVTFDGSVTAQEPWLTMYTDTNVTFNRASVSGIFEQSGFSVQTAITEVGAYGAYADSIYARHHISNDQYVLKEAVVINDSTQWQGEGAVGWTDSSFVSFSLQNPLSGSAVYQMTQMDSFWITVRDLQTVRIPYPLPFDTSIKSIIADGTFGWNWRKDRGFLSGLIEGEISSSPFSLFLSTHWDRDSMHLDSGDMAYGDNQIVLRAEYSRENQPFYSLKNITPVQVSMLSVDTVHIDLHSLSARVPQMSGASGTIDGAIAYTIGDSLRGTLSATAVSYKISQSQTLTIPEATAETFGDSIFLRGVLKYPPIRVLKKDSVSLEADDVFTSKTDIDFELEAVQDLQISIEGIITKELYADAILYIKGNILLPDRTGKISHLDVSLPFKTDLHRPFKSLCCMKDTISFQYSHPAVDTQEIEAIVLVDTESIDFQNLVIVNQDNDTLRGSITYSLSEQRFGPSNITGVYAGFVFQDFPIAFYNLDFSIQSQLDSIIFSLRSDSIQYQWQQGLVTSKGTVTNSRINYIIPLGVSQEAGSTVSRLSAEVTADHTETIYDLSSFETLQDIFRQNREASESQPVDPMHLDISVRTTSQKNIITSDILSMGLSGQLTVRGTWPYPLYEGQINALWGNLGFKDQQYTIRQLVARWSSEVFGDGTIKAEAHKRLARSCENPDADSCDIITQLDGTVSDMQFSYRTNCSGNYHEGADMGSLLQSIRRGCYQSMSGVSLSGRDLGRQALALLEPQINQRFSTIVSKYSNNWIHSAKIAGLNNLLVDSISTPVYLKITTKEFQGLQVNAEGGYRIETDDSETPWAYSIGLTYQIPFFKLLPPSTFRQIIKNSIHLEATMETAPEVLESNREDEIMSRLGITFKKSFWHLGE